MGRSLSQSWLDTNTIAARLGISPRQLRKIRPGMKAGHHYRVKNPQAYRPEYLWHLERIEEYLKPISLTDKN